MGLISRVSSRTYRSFQKMSKSIDVIFHDLINPLNSDKLDESLPEFLEQIRLDDAIIAKVVALIGHKFQSPIELEALSACHIIEYLMREGGHEIRKHVAMFKFLNDCIRILSPKYLGKRTEKTVKDRVIELIYCWSEALPSYHKLKEAYIMLRRNNIIKKDPKYNDRVMLKSSNQYERPSYMDENRELIFKTLISSNKKEDFAKANKLIQKLINDENELVEKQAKMIETIDQASSESKKLLKLIECLPAGNKGANLSAADRR